MARIELFTQTKKTSGTIKLRLRLIDGRAIQLYHRSEIDVDIEELSKFEKDGTPKKRANYNRVLKATIDKRINVLRQVYAEAQEKGVAHTTESFELAIDKMLHPDKFVAEDEQKPDTFVDRFAHYIASLSVSEERKKGYRVVLASIKRFLAVTGMEGIIVDKVDPNVLLKFADFTENEYKIAKLKKWSKLYKNDKQKVGEDGYRLMDIPVAPRSQNTVALRMKMLKAFFSQLEDADEIVKSPFRRMGRENRIKALKEQYADPVSLTLEELRKILETEVTTLKLQETKNAFLLQCALGCRISDFSKLTMDDFAISKDGIPYIRYVAKKTQHSMKHITETKTPLVRFAFDIIQESKLQFDILKNISGKDGFNKRIKQLLEECGIDREVESWNELSKSFDHIPLYSTASTKLGRKTNVTLLSRVQINSSIAGLHSEGSEAVSHYYDRSLQDLFLLMSRAFGEEPYKVDKELNIIQ